MCHPIGMARRRPRLSRKHVRVLVALVQLPAVFAVAAVAGPLAGLTAASAAVGWSYAALTSVRGLWSVDPRSKLHLHLGVWPFFAWFTACVAFVLLLPVLLGSWLLGVPATTAATATLVTAALVGLAAVRRNPMVSRVTLRFDDLPVEFDGYRIAQISDVHCGPFAPEGRVDRWVRRVNRLRADVVAVTGDLVTHGVEYVPAVARSLGNLRAVDGVFACMGNHDYFGPGERLVRALEAGGVRVLRNDAEHIDRDGAKLAVAGVDDTWIGRADVRRALKRAGDAFPVLLAHDPDLFPEAARHGARLTLSGHTHGGQVAVPFAWRRWNLANFVTRFSAGLHRLGESVLYVNRGIGWTGPPIRVGARAEIALITLRRRDSRRRRPRR